MFGLSSDFGISGVIAVKMVIAAAQGLGTGTTQKVLLPVRIAPAHMGGVPSGAYRYSLEGTLWRK